MSNFEIHELTEKAINRNSNIVHDTLENGSYATGKNLAGAVADLASANVAAPYDSTVTYAIGQYCLYEGDIYRCIAITTGAFDSTAWTQIVVTGELRRVVELTSAQYTVLSSAEKNNGTLYVITDEETTAADIPYSSGVSVADKLGEIPTLASGTVSVSSGVTANKVQLLKYGKVVFLTMAIKVSSPSSWQVIGTIPSAYFPKWSIFGVMINTTSANNLQTAHINVEPDGRIRLANTLPDSRDTYTFDLTWIIE